MKLEFSDEVMAARKNGVPLVALESSVLAQGLPRPQNTEAAARCEAAVRAAGAVPATIAVIDGRLVVGVTAEQTRRLCEEIGLLKIGSRDLAIAIAGEKTGGTTVSATCAIASAAGIALFATGGIGGVHRGAEVSFDISTDLGALRRYRVAVVCAGAKSVLDVPLTLEFLETLGVPVLGFGTHELPGFYSRKSGLPLEHSVSSAEEAARVVKSHLSLEGEGGLLFAVPPPAATEIPQAEIETQLAAAMAEAKGVTGKAVTPFLLKQLTARLSGRTLPANLALLENNASVAAQIAVALAR